MGILEQLAEKWKALSPEERARIHALNVQAKERAAAEERRLFQESQSLSGERRIQTLARVAGMWYWQVGPAPGDGECEFPTRETHRFSTLKARPDIANWDDVVAAAKSLAARQPPPFLTFTGPCGTGKTHLAYAIAWEWLEAGCLVRYCQAEELLDNLRRTFDQPQEYTENRDSFEQTFNRFKNVPLLVIDDLGAERLTEWGLAKLDALIDYRYINRLPLVITTNMGANQLPVRIADRLGDPRVGRIFLLRGPSWRRKGA